MMEKEDWLLAGVVSATVLLIMVCLFFAGGDYREAKIVNKLCGETNGRYHFCIEKKQWGIG